MHICTVYTRDTYREYVVRSDFCEEVKRGEDTRGEA